MASIEQTFIDTSPQTPLFHVRFNDDIIMIWTHGGEELEQFKTRANSTHPSIKFTTEISSNSLPFLDVHVCVTDTGIKTSLYRKPTDRPTYLIYRSFHPHHIKSSIVFIQLQRFKRIYSHFSDYEHQIKIITQSLLPRGFPYKLISEQINCASHIIIIVMVIYKCYFSGEHIALSINKNNNGVNIALGKTNRLKAL